MVGALNEISQAETKSYVTQGALEEPTVLSYMSLPIPPFPMIPSNPCDHSFSTLDEASKRVQSMDVELHRLMVFTTLDDVQNTILYMEWTITLSLAVAHMSVLTAIDVCALLGGFYYPIWLVQQECAGSLFFVGGMVGTQAENLCWRGGGSGTGVWKQIGTPTNDVWAEENHQLFLFQRMDSTGDRKRTVWVTCKKLTAPVPFLIPPPPGPTCAWDVVLQQNLASLYEEGLHLPSSGKRQWYCMWTPLLMGNHLPAQQALIFVPPSYHEQRRMAPSLLGIGVETLDISADLFSMNDERTPEVLPNMWYGLLVEPFVTETALLSMVDVIQSRGAEGWKQTHLGKKGLALRVIFKSLANRDEVYRLLKEDEKFSLVIAADLLACFNSWLLYGMVREPGYIQYLWKYLHPLAVHGTLMGLAPPSHSLPPSEPDYEFTCERECCHQTLIMADLLETGKYPTIVHSQGPDPPKRAYLQVLFSKEFLGSLSQAPCPANFSPEEALCFQCLEILLCLLADFNASFVRPVYPAVSGPYVKLLHFIASQVEFAAQSNHTQCRLGQSEDRVNNFRSSKAKHKGKKVDP
ncbi:hypothetical protein BS47DRAFT_1368965 [Hydnum rufescens UP504]|uniref:Uncharacterized protein n=1 Tax=Hydnum rufescens UP504 TaxID=1448309 RepID=A0A9P6AE12_9AGAM|nr:hypothetical protein BS47DRAFT_1368965 [Hydnum rufescens UP504]